MPVKAQNAARHGPGRAGQNNPVRICGNIVSNFNACAAPAYG